MAALKQVISVNYHDLDDHEVGDYAANVLEGMTDNSDYPEPKPPVAEAAPTIQAYIKSLAEARVGGRVAVARKDQLRASVQGFLEQWSEYASETTPGNQLAWLEANFRLTKSESAKRQALPAPSFFQTMEGPQRGAVKVRQSTQEKVRAYVVEYAEYNPSTGETGPWCYKLFSTATGLIEGLKSGQAYLFRGGAWNGTSDPNFSATDQRYVQ